MESVRAEIGGQQLADIGIVVDHEDGGECFHDRFQAGLIPQNFSANDYSDLFLPAEERWRIMAGMILSADISKYFRMICRVPEDIVPDRFALSCEHFQIIFLAREINRQPVSPTMLDDLPPGPRPAAVELQAICQYDDSRSVMNNPKHQDSPDRPRDVDARNLRLSWHAPASIKGQAYFQLQIATSVGSFGDGLPLAWDSGRMRGAASFVLVPPFVLLDDAVYYWRVRVWDPAGEVSAWSAAQRIVTSAGS